MSPDNRPSPPRPPAQPAQPAQPGRPQAAPPAQPGRPGQTAPPTQPGQPNQPPQAAPPAQVPQERPRIATRRDGTPPTPTGAPGGTPGTQKPTEYRSHSIDPKTGKYLGPVQPPPSNLPPVRSEATKQFGLDLDELLSHLARSGGSDLHLTVGSPPMVRINGLLNSVPGGTAIEPAQLEEALLAILTPQQREQYLTEHELDLSYTLAGISRYRVNYMRQRGSIAAVFRLIPWEVKPLESLALPKIIGTLPDLPRGLVLVTGPTGSGKSTTLAAMIDKVNRQRSGHIITIEDPIEFVHQNRGCIVNQREVGADTAGFGEALRRGLRQDPDVILIGEMRDLETVSTALTAAETGHLVFSTLHTQSAQETINRIVDAFPAGQQQQIRTQLAATLKAVVSQTLIPTADRRSRAVATEIMVINPAIATMIRRGDEHQIPQAIQGSGAEGMHTLNQDLARLVKANKITRETAEATTSDITDLHHLIGSDDTAAPRFN